MCDNAKTVDPLGLRRIFEMQDQITNDKNLFRKQTFNEVHVSRIETWYESIPSCTWKTKITSQIKGQVQSIHTQPNDLLGLIWEIYVAYELVSEGCEIRDIGREQDETQPEFIASKDNIEFLVECKFVRGSLKESHNQGFVEVTKSARKYRRGTVQTKTRKASKQLGGLDTSIPGLMAFCDVNFDKMKGVPPHGFPMYMTDVLKPEENLHAIWLCTNNFLEWPENTTEKSWLIHDGSNVDFDFNTAVLALKLGIPRNMNEYNLLPKIEEGDSFAKTFYYTEKSAPDLYETHEIDGTLDDVKRHVSEHNSIAITNLNFCDRWKNTPTNIGKWWRVWKTGEVLHQGNYFGTNAIMRKESKVMGYIYTTLDDLHRER